MLPRAQLAEIGIPVVPAVRSLRTVFERPLDHDRASDARDRPQRRAQGGAVVGTGAVIIDENGIRAVNVAVEPHPIENPFDRIVLRHREDDATLPEHLRLVRRHREREAPQFAQRLDRAGTFGNVQPQLGVAVEAPRPRLAGPGAADESCRRNVAREVEEWRPKQGDLRWAHLHRVVEQRIAVEVALEILAPKRGRARRLAPLVGEVRQRHRVGSTNDMSIVGCNDRIFAC